MNNTFDELCEKTFENDEEIISMKENQTFEKNFNLEKFPDKSNNPANPSDPNTTASRDRFLI